MAKDVPKEEGGWEEVEPDPRHWDVIVILLVITLGAVMFLRGQLRLPDDVDQIGLAVVCSSGIVILVPFLAYMMWKMRRVRADTIRRSVRHPWKRVADGIEEALSGQGIEFRKEIRGWRGPSYNLAFGTFKQIFHMAQTDLRVFVESRDQRGTGERGPPTEVSIGPVTDMTREHVDTLTGLLDGVFSEWDTTP